MDAQMKPWGRTDFERAFRPGELFSGADTSTMLVSQQVVGTVHLPSGHLIACDPQYLLSHNDLVPFAIPVAPGAYPVTLALVDYQIREFPSWSRIACARIDVASHPPAAWELALLPGQDARTLPFGRSFGFGVDSGMACFLDATTYQQILNHQDGLFLDGRLHGPWTDVLVDPTTGANLIAFRSGYGDGAYPSFWGRDQAGEICCFVTDFHILVDSVYGETHFPLPQWKETTLTHADFERIGITVRCVPQDATGHSLVVQMTGGHPTIVIEDQGRQYHSSRLYQYGHDHFEYRFAFKEPLSEDAVVTTRYFLGVTAL